MRVGAGMIELDPPYASLQTIFGVFLRQLVSMTPEHAQTINLFMAGADIVKGHEATVEAAKRAQNAAEDAAREADLVEVLRFVHEFADNLARTTINAIRPNLDRDEMIAALYAVSSAVYALVTQGLITDEHLHTLYDPWGAAFGPPATPEATG